MTGETVLQTLLRCGVETPHGCQAGSCQSCVLKCLEGHPPTASTSPVDEGMRADGCFLACLAPADSVVRIGAPGSAIPTWKASLVQRDFLTDDVVKLRFTRPLGFPLLPGRFVHLETEDGLRRSYSLATLLPAGQSEAQWAELDLEFHVRLIAGGEMSGRLRTLPMNAEVTLHGPLGSCFYSSAHAEQPILMVASGTGLAPLAAIASHALATGHTGPINLFHGAATDRALYFREEMNRMAATFPSFHYVPCADVSGRAEVRESSPLALALAQFPDLSGWRVFTCGHPALVAATKKKAFLAGASMSAISSDSFADQSGPK